MTTAIPTTVDQKGNLVDKAWEAQERLEARVSNLGRGKYGRVLRMARKPTPEEFRKTSIVAGIGIFFLGALGFVIWFLFHLLPQ